MAQYNLLDTDTVTLNKLLKSGNYKVPDFQRDYSWKKEHWEDLWEDILSIIDENKPVHYMGAIVLQDLNTKVLSIIDGQQRLATLSIIALAIIKHIQELVHKGIESDANTERVNDLMATYIGKKDAVSLHYSNKLELNENDGWFYKEVLVHWACKTDCVIRLYECLFYKYGSSNSKILNACSTRIILIFYPKVSWIYSCRFVPIRGQIFLSSNSVSNA